MPHRLAPSELFSVELRSIDLYFIVKMRKESEGDKCGFILGRDRKNSHIHMLGRRVNGLIRVAAIQHFRPQLSFSSGMIQNTASLKAEFCRHYLAIP